MIDRRTFVVGAAALLAMPAVPAFARRAAAVRPIGLQLYTLRTLFAADPVATLEQVARIGYREVEYGGGGYEAMDPAELRRTMDRVGLRAPAVHLGYEALSERFDRSVAMAKTLGADTVVLPYAEDRYRTEEGWRALVAGMNRIAARLADQGLGFAYHNHDFEFTTRPGGISLYDRLIRDADPKLVRFELDLFWAIEAGQDPLALIRRLAGRIYSYHVKDRTAAGKMTSVGAGTVDFAGIFRLNAQAGVRHFFVENDEAPAPYLPDVTASYTHLSRLLGR
ncbi:sugar phosphate isomerase/epimerase family protein [Sphingomonas sp. ac-8]|uniref:sugar phosphate isomerase/epimerase family protein n=1 Tax=Sphingomonas sp. ac-8 TaxID=3242977 RepID=UPI003A8024B0